MVYISVPDREAISVTKARPPLFFELKFPTGQTRNEVGGATAGPIV